MPRTRPSYAVALPALATLLLAGCGDARLEQLTANISRDSTFKVLAADGAATDSAPHIYREAQYLVNGKMYRIAFYTPTDRKLATDSVGGGEVVEERRLTPLVFVNDTLTGWGWKHWEEVAASINIPVEPRK